ncbi:MAG: hypothetical protein LBH18_01215 [Spirochaetaceae bacterium]|jgi:hypothetical protein|nr:hypothetical protein [Spirochaetaceae bacterium]
MAKKCLSLGMLAAALTLGFGLILTGCDNGTSGGGGGGGGGSPGILTITGLSSYEGKFVIVDSTRSKLPDGIDQLMGAATKMSATDSIPGVKVSEGKAVLEVYKKSRSVGITAYTGNDQNITLDVRMNDTAGPFSYTTGTVIGTVTVNFSSGNGTAAFVR